MEEHTMSTWENFEIDCTNHLNNKFSKYASFKHQGGANSTVPDILVTTTSGRRFYIEAKHSPAQCGQFVLLPDLRNRVFKYSSGNTKPIDEYSRAIMVHMNNDFDGFREAGTKGKDIIMENRQGIFSNWIINYYKSKNVGFIITNNYIIFPVENIADYFYITAKYRIKRSGSAEVGVKNLKSVSDHIRTLDYAINEIHFDNSKLIVSSPKQLHNLRFIFDGNEYMFSRRNNEYELRRLSNTYNANVIFSINLKSSVSGISDDEFINALR